MKVADYQLASLAIKAELLWAALWIHSPVRWMHSPGTVTWGFQIVVLGVSQHWLNLTVGVFPNLLMYVYIYVYIIISIVYIQSNGFSIIHVWMQEGDHKEGWAPKNRCFLTVVLRRLLRVPWTARRSKQSILKAINPEYSLEGLMLKPKLQYFDHLMWKVNSLE